MHEQGSYTVKVRRLRSPAYLFVDGRQTSTEALNALQQAGVQPVVVEEPADPDEPRPILLHEGGTHRGLQAIEGWIRLMQLWTQTLPRSAVFS